MSSIPFESHPSAAVVQITLGEVYSEVKSMRGEIQALVASLRPISRQVEDHEARLRHVDALPDAVEALERTAEDHEARSRSVERRAAMYAGGAAVLAGSAGSLITWALTAHR